MENKKDSNELELGKYLESDLLSMTNEEVDGAAATPVIPLTIKISVVVTGYISANTCPTTACTRAC